MCFRLPANYWFHDEKWIGKSVLEIYELLKQLFGINVWASQMFLCGLAQHSKYHDLVHSDCWLSIGDDQQFKCKFLFGSVNFNLRYEYVPCLQN